MKMFKSLGSVLGLIIATVIGLAIFVQPANAIGILDFGIESPTAGSIAYLVNGGPLVGTNIEVDNVGGIGTAFHDGGVPLVITGGLLNFTTGNLTDTTVDRWNFGGGTSSSIVLTGGIPALGIADGTILFQGSFGAATVITFGETFGIAGSSFTDSKNLTLADYFGFDLTLPGWAGNFNISFNADGLPPLTFSSDTVLSGDIPNTPVPEPASLLLLGSGLIAIVGFSRSRMFGK